MDKTRFDALARRLAATPRRSVLRALAGGALARWVGPPDAASAQPRTDAPIVTGQTAARCARPRKKCGEGRRCCGRLKCKGGRCRCPAGRTEIDGRCAPACTAACDASPLCDCLNVADDQTGDAQDCLVRVTPDTCAATDPCLTDADCGGDELCAKIACADGLNRCLRLCNDATVSRGSGAAPRRRLPTA